MEWGDDWLRPIQARLKLQYPSLSQLQLSAYNTQCRKVMKQGWKRARSCIECLNDESRFEQERIAFDKDMRSKHPWISDENLGRLFSQGIYYAMK